MAKVGLLSRGWRGKLAGMVFSKSSGGTVVRENVTPRNPKTSAQAVQRAIFATVAKVSASISEVVESSFDGFANGEDSRRQFVRENISRMRTAYYDGGSTVYLNPKESVLNLPNELVISRGSLGRIVVNPSISGYLGWQFDGNITLGSLRDTISTSIKAGSQLTFVVLVGDLRDPSTWQWRYCRMVISPTADSDTILFDSGGSINFAGFVVSSFEGLFFDEGDGTFEADNIFKMTSRENEVFFTLGSQIVNADDPTDVMYRERGGLCGGLIVSNYDSTKNEWVHSQSILSFADIGTFAAPSNVSESIPSYMGAAVGQSTSTYYTEQAESDDVVPYYSSVNGAIQGVVEVSGYQPKSVNFEAANTYGPVPEGSVVSMSFYPNTGASIDASSISVLNGESALSARRTRYSSGRVDITFMLPSGSAASHQINVSFNAYWNGGDQYQVGFRDTISIVQTP